MIIIAISIDLTKTVKEIITSIKTAIESLDTSVSENKTAIESLKKEILLAAHPVGSYYWSNESTDPSLLFGGTWEALPAGYTLIAQGEGSDSFGDYSYTAGDKYGERMHKLTVDELPSSVCIWVKNTTSSAISLHGYIAAITDEADPDKWGYCNLNNLSTTALNHGGNNYITNIQPATAAYVWKRTA